MEKYPQLRINKKKKIILKNTNEDTYFMSLIPCEFP